MVPLIVIDRSRRDILASLDLGANRTELAVASVVVDANVPFLRVDRSTPGDDPMGRIFIGNVGLDPERR